MDDRQHDSLFEAYVKQRSWPLDEGVKLRFWKQVDIHRRYRLRKWLEKVFRSCTLFKCKSRLTHVVCLRRDFATLYTQTLVEHPSAYFNSHAQFLKQGRSATIVKTRLGENEVVIKRYNIKSPLVYMKRLLGESRAARAWRMSHAMQALGIQTPMPLAMIQKRFMILPQEGYYISRFVPGQRLDHYLESKQEIKMEDVEQALVRLMDTLKLGHCYHGDLKTSNLIWHDGVVTLLDCEGAKLIYNPTAFEKAHARDWQRLLSNWPISHALRGSLEKYRGA
jgi:tRNA A-37 threonylcarbamoyl transferase component Bud32